MLSKDEQLIQLLKSHKSKLLLTKNEINGDLFGTLLAWGFFIKNLGSELAPAETGGGNFPTLYLPRYKELKKIYPFLPEYEYVIQDISGVRDFILSFNVKENDIKNVHWKKENGNLNIIITPEKGSIDPRDFSFLPAKFNFDLLFVLGTADFSELGETYEKNSDLFFELPIINVDTNTGNENFGQLNIVNPVSSCLAEQSVDLMMKINEEGIRNEVAQCLLTALVEATDNLKGPKVTPHTFDIAAFLMERGGNHQQILSALYDTESLDSLKLWGKLLERLKEKDGLIWSYISREELVSYELPDIMLRRFFVRLKNFIDLGNKKLVILWQEDAENTQAFIYKFDKENEKDRKIIEELDGELFNNEILQVSISGNNLENALENLEKKIGA